MANAEEPMRAAAVDDVPVPLRKVALYCLSSAAHPSCPARSTNRVTPPMMHIWFVPILGGPTAIDASDGQMVHGAERVTGPRNGTA